MLYYVPLEPYASRYTAQWSAARVGWLEKKWIQYGVHYQRIEGGLADLNRRMGSGSVLNPATRTMWAFEQSRHIVNLIDSGHIKDNDVIYFDDFWHPGLEMIGYIRHLKKCRCRLASFCHAQSVDKYDFTYPMRNWMRPIEQGFYNIYDYVFVNNNMLKELLEIAFGGPPEKVNNIGHVFDSEQARGMIPDPEPHKRRQNVVFSSRFDSEKQPHRFMNIAEAHMKQNMDVTYTICSGTELRSDDDSAIRRARLLQNTYPARFLIRENLQKESYYRELLNSAVQFSTSLQDWVSFCLLEAVTFGCYPMYPCFRSFPEAFGLVCSVLYPPSVSELKLVENLNAAITVMTSNHQQTADLRKEIQSELFHQIVRRHNTTWLTMLNTLGIPLYQVKSNDSAEDGRSEAHTPVQDKEDETRQG